MALQSKKQRRARCWTPYNLMRLPYQPHPSVRLFLWLCVALWAQQVTWLALVWGCGLMWMGAWWSAGARVWRNVWRLKSLMLALWIAFAWTTPGNPLWPSVWAPSDAGMLEGTTHCLRLILLVCCGQWVVASLSREDLLIGFLVLCAPLSRVGMSGQTFALRVWLTLIHTEAWLQRPRAHWRDIPYLLRTALDFEAGDSIPLVLTLQLPRFMCWDWLVMAVATVGLLGVYLQ